MNTLTPPSPMSFTGNISEAWKRWKQRWTLYAKASGVDAKDENIQCATFLHVMGEEGLEIFNTFQFTETEKDKIGPLIDKFESYCIPKTNVTFERYKFNMRSQKEGENIDQYVTELKNLAATCEYRDLRDEFICDRIVIGIKDNAVRGRLLREADLTLSRTIEMCRADEASKIQIKSLDSRVVNEVKRSSVKRERQRPFTKKSDTHQSHSKQNYSQKRKVEMCDACGYQRHTKSACPAINEFCKICHKKGHFARKCPSKKEVRAVTSRENHRDQYEENKVPAQSQPKAQFFLGSIESEQFEEPPWHVELEINDTIVDFKIDSGADVTVISDETYNRLKKRSKLKSTKTPLDSPGGKLKCIGQFIGRIQRRGKVSFIQCYVIPDLSENLLSRSAAVKLNLIARLESVSAPDIYELDVFGELGEIKARSVQIKLKRDAEPYSCSTARRVPFPMLDKVSDELKRMEQLGVIVKVTEPTEWCSPIVVVPKPSGNIRICVDLKHLNRAVSREKYMLPTVDDMIHNLAGSTVFSSLDASCGYWQLGLQEDSSKLTTFITPFGRYKFTRLPFGISSASEIFQREMSEILKDVPGVSVYQDDILIHGKDLEEHDQRLEQTLNVIEKSGLKLNKDKCSLRQTGLDFLGHWISKDGISIHPEKVKAIMDMKPPENITSLRSFLGMINYLGRFVKDLASQTKPLNELLCKDTAWTWGPSQQQAFSDLKKLVSSAPILTFYDVNRPTVVCADASGYGLGAVLMQLHNKKMMPIAYCSRTLTKAEQGYAAIEKECLACTWACEKFARYLYGLESVTILTDHKPLIPLINSRNIDQTPIRCQRLLLRMMRFNVKAEHIPGRDQVVADALSRQPIHCDSIPDMVDEIKAYIGEVMSNVPISDPLSQRIKDATDKDESLQIAITYVREGWPRHMKTVSESIRDLFHVRGELSVVKGLLVRGDRIVIPLLMREEILGKIHHGHMGITKCRERASQTVWWPGLSKQIEEFIKKCFHCQSKQTSNRREPLISTPLPDHQWQKVGCDLLEFQRRIYVVLIDYYSRYIEIECMPSSVSAGSVIHKMKNIFARWGVPEIVFSDNGPQFQCREFAMFAEEYSFKHETSSPHYPQSNGEAERAVQTARRS